jgi:hypothetical protein
MKTILFTTLTLSALSLGTLAPAIAAIAVIKRPAVEAILRQEAA